MRASEIKNLIHDKKFLGVFPSDQIPSTASGAMIVNTDTSTQGGEHWVSLFVIDKKHVEYFDAFGLGPIVPEIISYIQHFDQCTYSSIQIQDLLSTSCGYYCVAYVKNRLKGMSLEKFVHLFTRVPLEGSVENENTLARLIAAPGLNNLHF